MTETPIFRGIPQKDLEKMLACFQAQSKKIPSGGTILTYTSHFEKMGILLSGEASLVRFDPDGNRTILEYLTEGDAFGEMFAIAARPEQDELSVIASRDSICLFIEYDHLIRRCPNACPHHSLLVSNTLLLMSKKAKNLSERIEILSRRTLREKLLTYFELQSARHQNRHFYLPFSLNNLADYLCVDRSAMLREMKKLRESGRIASKGREITLLSDKRSIL
ncbi:MAG: Crp/Fnr family transcriptional regulator [Lachnospiraceae bacterium]|nr:Crp/Fnr family transcriptional regulator [Lachnospiraceae bacterium]